jgi:hypothetical protein
MTDNLDVDPDRLQDAIDRLGELLKTLQSDKQDFGDRMHNYTWDTTQSVAAERTRRIDGRSYDHRTADQHVRHGATTDWTNPFGHFTDADRFFKQIDDVRDHANKDHESLVATLQSLQQALRQVKALYERVEKDNAKGVRSIGKNDIDAIFTAVRNRSGHGSADF